MMIKDALAALNDPKMPKIGQTVKITTKGSDPPNSFEGKVTVPPSMSWETIDGKRLFVLSIGVYDHGNFYFLPEAQVWVRLKEKTLPDLFFPRKKTCSAVIIELEVIG